jgi:hypothetical protein
MNPFVVERGTTSTVDTSVVILLSHYLILQEPALKLDDWAEGLRSVHTRRELGYKHCSR